MGQPRLWVIRHPAVPGLAAVRGEGVATDIVRHTHAKTVVGLCLSGGRRIEAGGGRWCLAPGQGFVIPGGVAHACAPWGASDHAYVVLAAAPQCFPACSEGPGMPGAPGVWPSVWEDRKAAALLLRAVEALADGQAAACVHFAALCRLLHLRAAPLPPLDPAVRAAMAVVDAAPDAPVALADLAIAAGVSPFRLERLFTRDLGVPPGEYILSRRVAGAAARIEAGEGLADAALASGFCDQSHLTRHFRRRMGVPPGKYGVEGELEKSGEGERRREEECLRRSGGDDPLLDLPDGGGVASGWEDGHWARRRGLWSREWGCPAGRKAGQHGSPIPATTGVSGEAPHFKKSGQ